MEYYWTETPKKLESVPDPQQTGEYLEGLSKNAEGSLQPGDIEHPKHRSSVDAAAEQQRALQVCDMVLCLGVKGGDEPEWLRRAKANAQQEKDRLESGSGPGWTGPF